MRFEDKPGVGPAEDVWIDLRRLPDDEQLRLAHDLAKAERAVARLVRENAILRDALRSADPAAELPLDDHPWETEPSSGRWRLRRLAGGWDD